MTVFWVIFADSLSVKWRPHLAVELLSHCCWSRTFSCAWIPSSMSARWVFASLTKAKKNLCLIILHCGFDIGRFPFSFEYSHCDIQPWAWFAHPWAWFAHPHCNASVDLAFNPLVISAFRLSTQTHNRLFRGLPGWPGARRKSSSELYRAKEYITGRHTDNPAERHSIRTNKRPASLIPHWMVADSQSRLVGVVWGLAAAWHWVCIEKMNWVDCSNAVITITIDLHADVVCIITLLSVVRYKMLSWQENLCIYSFCSIFPSTLNSVEHRCLGVVKCAQPEKLLRESAKLPREHSADQAKFG